MVFGNGQWELIRNLHFPWVNEKSPRALEIVTGQVQEVINSGRYQDTKNFQTRLAMNALGNYFKSHVPAPDPPPSIVNAAPSLPPGEEELNPIFGTVDPLPQFGKVRNWDTAPNANINWINPGGARRPPMPRVRTPVFLKAYSRRSREPRAQVAAERLCPVECAETSGHGRNASAPIPGGSPISPRTRLPDLLPYLAAVRRTHC